jgi:pyrimidine 5'-nucleotidase
MSFRAAALHSKTFIAGRRTTRMTAATTTTTSSGATKKQHTIFFDLDDCLYKNDWKVANLLTERIEKYTVGKLGLKPGYAYELYKKYGTCLKGMMVEKILDEDSVDDYLLWAHDVPLEEHISKDVKLRDMLTKVKEEGYPMYIFTASARHHAEKCLQLLGISDLFIDIIDVRAVEWATKHDEEAYERAMRIAGVEERERCVFIDDSTSNIKTAKKMGWHTILCGTKGRDCGSVLVCAEANHIIETAHEFSTEKHVPPSVLADDQPSK